MPDVISFQSGALTLRGVLYKPAGSGPFPAVLYNHGSAPGMLNEQAFEVLGPLFVKRGWVFFAPYRRGQGLSLAAGPYIGDEIASARTTWVCILSAVVLPAVLLLVFVVGRKRRKWVRAALGVGLAVLAAGAIQLGAARASAATMARLLESEHFDDQAAALWWLQGQTVVDRARIATAGNSFGGVEAVLGAERLQYCAAVDASGGAESWAASGALRKLMTRAVRGAKAPIFFFQAQNDHDTSPTRTLGAEMERAGKPFQAKIYPAFGASESEGHAFGWAGSAVWADDVFRFLEAHCGEPR